MKRELYATDLKRYVPVNEYKGDAVRLVKGRVSPKNMGWKEAILWNVACAGRVKAYCLYDSDRLVHRSLVVRGRLKFTFLNRGDIEIGPCWTDPEYRGRKYYPYVISNVIASELKDGGKAWMIVNNENTSSINGILKVGFEKTGDIVIKDFLKRQIRVNDVDETRNE